MDIKTSLLPWGTDGGVRMTQDRFTNTLWRLMTSSIIINELINFKIIQVKTLSLLAVTCRLLISFANSLDPDQDRQKAGPDLDPNGLTL